MHTGEPVIWKRYADPSGRGVEMNKLNLFAPQWQDSGSTNELYSGAVALKGYFESIGVFPISEVKISEKKMPVIGNNILGYDILKQQLSAIHAILLNSQSNKIMAIGGGCGIEVPIVSYLLQQHPKLQVIWFDAHGDLNSPESSPSKYFHGMPLRFIVERQNNEIGMQYNLLDPSNVCLVGTRDLDPPEEDFIESRKIKVVSLSENYWGEIKTAVKRGVPTYIHVDLDVIDPQEYKNVKCPVLKGLSIADLERSIDCFLTGTEIIGMSIVENIETDASKIRKLHGIFERAISI